MKTVQVQYTCAQCGLFDRVVRVPERVIPDVVQWLDHIAMPRVMSDHAQQSPNCKPKTLTNIKFPVTNGKVGGAP